VRLSLVARLLLRFRPLARSVIARRAHDQIAIDLPPEKRAEFDRLLECEKRRR